MLLHSTFSSSCNNPSNKAYHTLLFHKEAVGLAIKSTLDFWDLYTVPPLCRCDSHLVEC
eukprot:m.69417 g.69417  ORF g.69417 m.69417 type:complete len:59 (+) comp14124_c0_seq4:371-547(+)